MNDDFNTAIAIAALNELSTYINKLSNLQLAPSEISPWVLERAKAAVNDLITNVFGLFDDASTGGKEDNTIEGLMSLILELRAAARSNKDWPTSDKIRDALTEIGIAVKDGKEGASWSIN
jgi:cysteinyl-tRNA synthetase